ncbi:MAG: ComEC/Rec2 family competence protein [Rhizobiaceae bacterium]
MRTGPSETDERKHFSPRTDVAPGEAAEHVPEARQPAELPSTVGRQRSAHIRAHVRRLGHGLLDALETEWDHATPFLFAPVFLGIGALAYFNAAAEPAWTPLLLGFAAVALCARLARARPAALRTFAAALLVVAGMLAGKVETWRADTRMLGSAVTSTLTGTVAAIERQQAGRARLVIDIEATERPKLKYAPDRVRLVARVLPPGLAPGARITGRARLIPPSGPMRPRGYDFSFHNYFDGLGAVGFHLGAPAVLPPATGASVFRPAIWLEQARDALSQRIRDRAGGGPAGEVAAALVTGAKQGIPESVNEALRRTGLAHILSISGLHMALVAGTAIAVLRLGFALFPGFASRHPVRKFAAGAALVVAFAYLFVSGAGIATQRSFIMLAVMLVALLLDRPAITMRNLAIAATVIIAWHPHEVAGPSFQMSFAATAALIAVYAAWSARRARRAAEPDAPTGRRRAGPVATALRHALALAVTSLVAGSATAIFGIWHFQRVAPLGLLANLAAMPLVSTLVIPSALLGVVLLPFDLDGPAFRLMGWAIDLVLGLAGWFSERSPADGVGAIPVTSLVAATLGLLLATLPVTRLRWLGAPFFLAAVLFVAGRDAPDVLIAEDGRLVAVTRSDGGLSVNRTRPRAFTLEIWMKSVAADAYFGPVKRKDAIAAFSGAGQEPERFICDTTLCIARLASGAVVAHAATDDAARQVCRLADLIVVADATGRDKPCAGAQSGNDALSTPLAINARQLARYGATAVKLRSADGSERGTSGRRFVATARHAVSTPWRPWHAHRAFSREARGLRPYRRKTAPTARAKAASDSGKSDGAGQ